MTAHDVTRRQALGAAGALLAGSQIAPGSTAPAPVVQPGAERAVVAPRAELVNTQEYEEQAKLKLAPAVYSLIAGGVALQEIAAQARTSFWYQVLPRTRRP